MFRQPVYRCFNCIRAENLSLNYIQQGEPGTIADDSQASEEELHFKFFDRMYTPTFWYNGEDSTDFASICNLASHSMEMLVRDAFGPSSFDTNDCLLVRKHICELFLCCRTLFTSPAQKLNFMNRSISTLVKEALAEVPKLSDFPNYILLSSWEQPNIKQTAAYNVIHFTLDMYWLTISLAHQLEENGLAKLQVFERNITEILQRLIHCSLLKFNKLSNYTNLCSDNIYLCSCYTELWLLIQLYLEQVANDINCKDFWYYFNKSLMNEMASLSGKDAVACLWVLVNVAQLQGHDSNGIFIGPHHHRVVSNHSMVLECFKHITSAVEMHDQLLCCCLHFLALLQETWWKRDVSFDIINLLWEFFYKKLNKLVINKDGSMAANFCDYSVLAENILQYNLELLPGPLNSYDIFLKILNNYFMKFPTQWPKLKGRIYTRLSGPKMADFTEVGLHNLIKMFCVLGHAVNFSEVSNKVHSLISTLPASRQENSCVIWSAYISLMVMRCNFGMPLTETDSYELSTSILFLVETASGDRSKGSIMRIFLEGLKKIVLTDCHLNCYHLFGGWISRYLQWCTHTDACYLIGIFRCLLLILANIGRLHTEWWAVMDSNVVPYIVETSNYSDTFPEVAELAALLVSADGTRFKHLLEHLTGNNVNVNFCCKFLHFFLKQDRRVDLNFAQETLLKQAWVRISLLTTDKSVLSDLTTSMRCLPNWFAMDSECQSHAEIDDTLYNVIRSAGLRLRDCKSVDDTAALKNWFEVYFGKMDQWIAPNKHRSMLLTMRIYTTVAVLYLHCAPALYTKLKNTCIFYRLTALLLLSESANPNEYQIIAMRNTWHLFVRGIGRLDYKSDIYLESVLRDMAIKYVPHMNDSNSPIIRCLDTEFEISTTTFILDKISSTLISCKSRHSHEHCLPALKIVLEMSRKECDDDNSEILMRTVIPSLFEQLMFTEDSVVKDIVIQIMRTLKNNKNSTCVTSIFKKSVMNIIDKHLAFNSGSVFRLMELLANISQTDVENIMVYFSEAITKVEHMRGVQFDRSLRSGLLRIEEILQR